MYIYIYISERLLSAYVEQRCVVYVQLLIYALLPLNDPAIASF